jgi:hypothetical protein
MEFIQPLMKELPEIILADRLEIEKMLSLIR